MGLVPILTLTVLSVLAIIWLYVFVIHDFLRDRSPALWRLECALVLHVEYHRNWKTARRIAHWLDQRNQKLIWIDQITPQRAVEWYLGPQ